MSDLILIDDNTVTDLLMQLELTNFLRNSELNPELQSLQSQHPDEQAVVGGGDHQLQLEVKEGKNNFEMVSNDVCNDVLVLVL